MKGWVEERQGWRRKIKMSLISLPLPGGGETTGSMVGGNLKTKKNV